MQTVTDRYLITRYCTDNPNMFNELSDEARESISEVHFADQIGAQGTFGVSLEPDFAEYISKADNLLPVNGLMRLSDYGLGASLNDDGALEPLEPHVEGYPDLDLETDGSLSDLSATSPASRFYAKGPVLDQGREGACVGFCATNFLRGGPIRSYMRKNTAELNRIAIDYYHLFQKNDEWPGEDYSGTSVSAAVKMLVEEGRVEAGAMTRDIDTQDRFILNESSLMLAGDWFEGSYRTDANGFIRPTGRKVGGHAFWQRGLSKWRTKYIFNSWGNSFGFGGIGYISRADSLWWAKYGNLRGYAAVQTAK